MSEIQDVAQIVRVSYEGVEICAKLTGASWKFVKEFFALLKKLIDQEKLSGKTAVKKLLKNGGDLQVFKFRTEDLKTVKKLADKHKILYSILPDINKKDGMSEILFHSQAAPRMQVIMEMLKDSKIETMDDYFSNGEPEELEKMVQDAGKKQPFGERDYQLLAKEFYENPGCKVSDVRMKLDMTWMEIWPAVKHMQKHDLLELGADGGVNMKVSEQEFAALAHTDEWKAWFPEAAAKGAGVSHDDSEKLETIRRIQKQSKDDLKVNGITIDRKMVTQETEHHIKTRIPYKKNEHIWLRKEDMSWINDNKTIYTTLEKEKTYTVLTDENQFVRKVSGEQLYAQSYDAVKKEKDRQERERIRKKKQKYQESQKAIQVAKRSAGGKERRR